jgi:hypothetical protein
MLRRSRKRFDQIRTAIIVAIIFAILFYVISQLKSNKNSQSNSWAVRNPEQQVFMTVVSTEEYVVPAKVTTIVRIQNIVRVRVFCLFHQFKRLFTQIKRC